ncbi:MAG: hypothetical protein ABSB87_13245 [Terriglobales bacterium]|jgi:hypothetical protein
MSSFMAVAVGPDAVEKIRAIVRSHPDGITLEEIMGRYGFTNSNAVRAALRVLEEQAGPAIRYGVPPITAPSGGPQHAD